MGQKAETDISDGHPGMLVCVCVFCHSLHVCVRVDIECEMNKGFFFCRVLSSHDCVSVWCVYICVCVFCRVQDQRTAATCLRSRGGRSCSQGLTTSTRTSRRSWTRGEEERRGGEERGKRVEARRRGGDMRG